MKHSTLRRSINEVWPYLMVAGGLAAGTLAIDKIKSPADAPRPIEGVEVICTANLSITEREEGWRVMETGRRMTIGEDVRRGVAEVRLKRAALFCEFGDGRQHPVSLWYWRARKR